MTLTEPEATPPASAHANQLPSTEDMQSSIKLITDNAQRLYQWNYTRERPQLVTLYNKAMASQWNSVTELDWTTQVDPVQAVDWNTPFMQICRAAADEPGSPLASWSDTEFTQLGIENLKATLSQFMHGEQGAMIVAAKLTETVPWIDAKYYAATQTMDEARHTEVFAKYLHEKLGEPYEMSPNLEAQITDLIQDSRWDIAYLGMQIVIESLALAAFGEMMRKTDEPLLKKLLRYVISDEARHVAFGIISLQEYYENLTEAELKDRQEFMLENTIRGRNRSTNPEIWERMGVSVDQVLPHLQAAAKRIGVHPFAEFRRQFFAKLVPNTRKLGLLDANGGYLREQWGEAGLMEFEFADDTASDYDSYDAIAADRAAAAQN